MAESPFPSSNAWEPVQTDIPNAGALQALMRGDASPEQQRRALPYIVEVICRTYDLSARPGGPEGDRATLFAEGKRFVGLQIVKLTKVNIAKLLEAADGKPREQG